MRIVVPYRPRMLFRRTYEAARASGLAYEFVELRNRDEPVDPDRYRPTYGELLADLWRGGSGFIVLEHDVVPYEGALEAITCCPEPWCGYSYRPNGGISSFFCNLGCTKFAAPMVQAVPDALDCEHPWTVSDAYLSQALTRAGYRPHRHTPDVEHRGTRHTEGHYLGNDFIDLDEGEPVSPELRYERLQPRGRLGAYYMDDGQAFAQQDSSHHPALRLLDQFHRMMAEPVPVTPAPRCDVVAQHEDLYAQAMNTATRLGLL